MCCFLLASCAPQATASTPTPAFTEALPATETVTPTAAYTPTPAFSPTPDLYYLYTNEYLRSRLYGGGEIEFLEVLGQNVFFTRYLIRYP
ncbi:MAG TPA: hypothetical protein VMJ90_07580, partial [Anaerolineales bacterium]|nr:hypothetical protein [Anaerolineales bacterium]